MAGSAFGGAADDHRLATGDKITATVFGQPKMWGDVMVDGGGYQIISLIDPVPVANLTVIEAQEALRARAANGILQQPSVSVRMAELRPIHAMGDMRTPGAYRFRFGSTVRAAVPHAGGFNTAETAQGTASPEFADRSAFELPAQPKGTNDPGFAAAVANGKDAFAAQTGTLKRRLDVVPPRAREIREVRLQYVGGVMRAGAKRAITMTRLLPIQGLIERTADAGAGTLTAVGTGR